MDWLQKFMHLQDVTVHLLHSSSLISRELLMCLSVFCAIGSSTKLYLPVVIATYWLILDANELQDNVVIKTSCIYIFVLKWKFLFIS